MIKIRSQQTKKSFAKVLLVVTAIVAGTATAGYIPYNGAAAPAEKMTNIHSAQALAHSKSAVIHGAAGHTGVLTRHAEIALEHAQAAELVLQGAAKENLSEAMIHLNAAIKHGQLDQADIATGHVNQAISYIQASIAE
jgi:hypothetical protein